MSDMKRVPATGVESAMSTDLMRVLLVHTLLRRKTPIVVTPKQYEDPELPRVMLRVVMDRGFSVRAWLELVEDETMRRGVAYVPDPPAND